MNEKEIKVLNELKENEYLSTNEISKKTGINWYKVDYLLYILEKNDKVQKLELTSGNYWRKK